MSIRTKRQVDIPVTRVGVVGSKSHRVIAGNLAKHNSHYKFIEGGEVGSHGTAELVQHEPPIGSFSRSDNCIEFVFEIPKEHVTVGIGRGLLAEWEKFAKDLGCKFIWARCTENNVHSIRLFEKFGWHGIGQIDSSDLLVFGKYLH